MKTKAALCLVTASLLWCGAPVAVAAPPITAAAFSPRGDEVVLGSQAGIEVRSWPALKHRRQIATRLVHVHDLVFSPSGDVLAAAGGAPAESGDVELLRFPSGEMVGRVEPHEDLVYHLAWRPDERALVTASADRSVALLDAGGQLERRFAGHSRGVLAVAFLRGTSLIISAGLDHSLRVWETSSGELVRTLDNHTAAVRDLAVRPDAAGGLPMIASAGADRTVRLWQPTIGRLVRFARLRSAPLDIQWTSDGSRLLACCVDGHLRVIDPETVEVISEVAAIDGWAYTLAIAPDDRHALVGGAAGQLRIVPLAEPARRP